MRTSGFVCAAIALVVCFVVTVHAQTTISNYVNLDGVRFATLDDTVMTETSTGCQTSPITIPSGWALAANNAKSKLAIMSYQWGTTCVVLKDGASFYSRSGDACGTAQLTGSLATGYQPISCSRRVLIQQNGDANDVDVTIAPQPTSYIVQNGIAYATLDGTAVDDQGVGCASVMQRLPTGWAVAADNAATRSLFLGQKYTFGTACAVLKSGNSYATGTNAVCGTGVLLSLSTTWYAPRWCDARIIISKTVAEPNTWEMSSPITNYVVRSGMAYATMDNTASDDPSSGCQNRAYRLPTGWSLATAGPGATAAAQSTYFGTVCLILADGSSLYHDGSACSGGLNQLLSYNGYYAALWCDRRVMIQRAASNSLYVRPAVARTLGMKLLVLTSSGDESVEPELSSVRQALVSMMIPYDVYAVAPSANAPAGTLTELSLYEGGDQYKGKYQGFVVTTDYFFRANEAGCLSSEARSAIMAYQRVFGARLAVMYSFPNQPGVQPSTAYSATGDDVLVRLASTFTTQAKAMPSTARFLLNLNIWHYPATIADTSIATPVFEFIQSDNSLMGTAAAVINQYDGREEMHFYFASASWSLSSSIVAQAWVPWVTRNLYIGARRVSLTAQLDDLFLSTETWDAVNGRPNTDGTAYRAKPADLDALSSFAAEINKEAPGSNITYAHAYNGAGVTEAGGPTVDTLYTKVQAVRSAHLWESHTWSHPSLNAPATYDFVYAEINNNIQFAKNLFVSDAFSPTHTFSAMATPMITGLFNGDALRAIYDNGVYSVVGDNTRVELAPTPYHPIHSTTAVHGFDKMMIIPRYATEIYYDCSLPAEEVSEYNYVYRNYWGRDLTLEEILTLEAQRMTRIMLTFRYDPHMLHQANMRTFTYYDPKLKATAKHSLVSLWTRYVFMQLRQVTALPVYTFSQPELLRIMLEREEFDNCGVSGTLNMDTTGKIVSFSLKPAAGKTCRAPVSGAGAVTDTTLVSETYGPDNTVRVPLKSDTPVLVKPTTALIFA